MIQSISHLTEKEFTTLLKKICADDFRTEQEGIDAVIEFERLSEHPDGSDLIYYPAPGKSGASAIVAEVKKWRAENGKPGFKAE